MLTITVALFAVLFTLWILWRKRRMSLFKDLNIPGPPPSIFFGNYWELLRKGPMECQQEWIEKYGRVLGFYHGIRPVLLISDLDLLKQIQQKDFHNFSDRPDIFAVASSTRYNSYALTTINGKRWKEIRSIITPTFTTSKLKMMSPIISQAVDELFDAVGREAKKGKPFDIYRLFQNLTMDVIARTALGIYTRAQTDPKEPFIKHARVVFSIEMGYMSLLAFCFPEIRFVLDIVRRLILRFRDAGKNPRNELREGTVAAIKARRADPKNHRKDALQLMMDAKVSQESISDSNLTAGENDDHVPNGVQNSTKSILKMNDEEVTQNAVLFLLAGYETTSTALAFATHIISHHPEVQEKIREEVNYYLQEGNGKLNYETVHKMQYLDRVLNESLRIYPPVTYFVNRQPAEDIVYGDICIPKKMPIQVPVYNLHHDPAYWEDPEKFDPDRFLPERKKEIHPMAFQVFGAGPRNCVGMRFAQMEAKMALAKLLHKYKIFPGPGRTEKNLEISPTVFTMRPKNGVIIRVEECT